MALLVASAALFAACSTDTGTPADETTPTTTPAPTSTSTSTSVAPPTSVTTTIPTTSVPPSTLAPPDLPPTTLPVPPTTSSVTDEFDEGIVLVTPEDDLAALVAGSPRDTRFIILPGIHRTDQAEPKDGMTFEGFDGAVLNGSVVLDGWEQTEDGWDVAGVELNMTAHGECVDGYEACSLRNDLYIDDAMLWRVDERSELEPGTWWSDGRRIVVADDPTDRKVEVSLTEHAFRSDADNVTIRNLIVEKYASLAQGGAIQAQLPGEGSRGQDWLIENVEVRLNHASGIRAGDGTIIRNVYSHHNGQHGITGGEGVGIVVESSEIAFNNLRGFNWGWEAGGAKFTRTEGLVLRDLTVHHNLGPGLWTDIDCYDTTYDGNLVYSNSGPGIFHEISFDAVIRNNEVYDNGFIKGEWLWGAGILIAASTDVEVYNNTVTNNADGITGIQQDRTGDNGPSRLQNLHVYNNTITMWFGETGVVQDIGDSSVFTDRDIVFESNTYIGAGHDEAFAWDNSFLTWEGWLETGQGAGSTRSDG
ncbi:MAG: right-handed parallel beta-helix repeat-containing protein [Acidimicrobiia bacterium]|nr:right-handed parallel beta-helix repeat-containing protein [Acidimicrobiia bacterium]